MCDEFFFAGDHLLYSSQSNNFRAYTNAPFLFNFTRKGACSELLFTMHSF